MTDERSVTPTDLRLLGALARTANVVRASRLLGIGRDRAVYRLRRLARLYGRPVASATRGGRSGGGTRLTPLGLRLLSEGPPGHGATNRWTGTYRRGPPPSVVVAPGLSLEVAFRAPDGSRVVVGLDPEELIVSRRPVELSARNALPVTVDSVRPRPDGTAVVAARWGTGLVRAVVTEGSVGRLGIVPGRRVVLYAKAVAVRRLATLGSPRS